MRTRPRPRNKVARVRNVRWTLVPDGPKRSVDVGGAKREPTRKRKGKVSMRISVCNKIGRCVYVVNETMATPERVPERE